MTWDKLAHDARCIFATPLWATTWWKHLGPSGAMPWPVAVFDLRGDLVALVPMYTWKTRPLRVQRLIGHGPGDQLGPICVPGMTRSVSQLMRTALDFVGWDVFVGERLSGSEDWESALRLDEVSPTGSPVLPLDGRSWEEILAGMSTNARQQVRRRERSLRRSFDVQFRLADSAARLDDDLDSLFRLHGERWGRNASAYLGRDARFHRAFSHEAFQRGWLRLWFLELDGVPVAAWHGFRFAGVESYYQAGWDQAFARHSPASVLLVHTIRAAAADGMSEYRFLQGDEAYKYRYATEDEGLVSLVASNGRKSAAFVSAGMTLRRYAVSARARTPSSHVLRRAR
jgi:CelD/BcsL family acetyltransferase involved in cellulose biosynthesis